MTELKVEIDAADAGLDPGRLDRLDRHFRGYVDDGRLAGWLFVLTRGGRIVHISSAGHRDREADLPIRNDTIFRIYSMTKPITSVAAMMLYEEGALQLTDPVEAFIPSFRNARVYRAGPATAMATRPAAEPMRVWHLLTHTAGLTYGFHHAHGVDEAYRTAGFELGTPAGLDLAECCDRWASLPLLFDPGTEWNYSVASDVLGRVVEVVSGMSLDRFMAERIFTPLGMADTAFSVAASETDRLAALYAPQPRTGTAVRLDELGRTILTEPAAHSGGGGLASTAHDYHRFTQMLLRGGELDGVRLLSSRTIRYMTINHLPGGADLDQFGRPLFAETSYAGVGFGLGFSVVIDPARVRGLCSPGEYGWGGAASTAFWVDPAEDMTAMFFTQLMPSSTYPIRPQLRQLVHQALVD